MDYHLCILCPHPLMDLEPLLETDSCFYILYSPEDPLPALDLPFSASRLSTFLDLIISRHRILFLHNNSTYFKTYDRRISKKTLLISQHYKTFRFLAMCNLIAGPGHERTAVPDRVCTWKSNPSSLSDLSNDGCGYVPGDDSEPQSKDPGPHFIL